MLELSAAERESATVVRLFAASLHPTLDALDAWLANGHLPAHPFLFIRPHADISTESPGFWEEAFTIHPPSLDAGRSEADQEAGIRAVPMTCPAFLQPLAAGILAAGKSAILLQANRTSASRCANSRSQTHTTLLVHMKSLYSEMAL